MTFKVTSLRTIRAWTRRADTLLQDWAEQLATIVLSDGAGGRRPAGVDDLTAALGRETFAPDGPAEVEEVFRVLAGEHGVSLDEQLLADSAAPGTRALPVTLLGSTFTPTGRHEVAVPGSRRHPRQNGRTRESTA